MPSREEFKERIGSLPIAASEVVKLVDEIFDALESQKCETCKWYIKSIHICNNNDSFANQYHATVLDTDGCNTWRSKDA